MEDPDDFLGIARFAFGMPVSGIERDRRALEEFSSKDYGLYGAYDGNKLVAGYDLYGMKMRFRNSVIPVMEIAYVCSRPDYRGKGAIRQLLTDSLNTAKDKDIPISVLYPFDTGFYRKYGWEVFERRQYVEFSPSILKLPDSKRKLDAEALDFPDQELMDYYNRYASVHNAMIVRDEKDWKNRLRIYNGTEVKKAVFKFSEGPKVFGMIEYLLDSKNNSLFAMGFIHEDEATRVEMLRFLKGLSHQVKTVKLMVPAKVSFWPYLSDRPKTTIEDGAMIRIVSVEMLDGTEMGDVDFDVSIKVVDEQAPWNDGTFRLKAENGKLRVEKCANAQLKCGIGTLSAILSGFTNFEETTGAGRIEVLDGYVGCDLPKLPTFVIDFS